MTDDSSFKNNPFKVLEKGRFPQQKKTGAPAAPEKRGKRIARQAAVPADDEDASLFLAAMGNVERQPAHGGSARGQGTGQGGFAMEEQCAMPQVKKLKEKKKGSAPRRESGAAAPAAPAAVAPSAGTAEDAAAGLEAVVAASEEDDFLLAMKQVTPLQGRGRDVPPAVAQSSPPPSADTSLQDFLDGKLEFALSMTDEYMEGHVVGLDQMIMNKLRAGGLSPEAHLDLHGLNAQQAFETLRGFMRGSWYKGLRTILVVPGRGKNSPDGVGVLRGKLQSWLTQDPFKRVVLAFCTAQPHDGGPGSVYVLLRKYKKKGRVYWERMPADADLYESGDRRTAGGDTVLPCRRRQGLPGHDSCKRTSSDVLFLCRFPGLQGGRCRTPRRRAVRYAHGACGFPGMAARPEGAARACGHGQRGGLPFRRESMARRGGTFSPASGACRLPAGRPHLRSCAPRRAVPARCGWSGSG